MFPYLAARGAASAVGLGTDGAGLEQLARPASDLKIFALLQKHEARDPGGGSRAAEAWEIATGRAVAAARRHGRSRSASRPTSCCCARTRRSSSIGDFTADLVYAASGSVVDTTVVNGRVLMRGGRVEGADEVLARALERARRLGPRLLAAQSSRRSSDRAPSGRGRGRRRWCSRPPGPGVDWTPAQPGRSAARRRAPSR